VALSLQVKGEVAPFWKILSWQAVSLPDGPHYPGFRGSQKYTLISVVSMKQACAAISFPLSGVSVLSRSGVAPAWAPHVQGHAVASGHHMAEEAPQKVTTELRHFLSQEN